MSEAVAAPFHETVQKTLWCDLHEHERFQRGITMSGQMAELREMRYRNDSARKKMKSDEERLETSIALLVDAIETRKELRPVDCRYTYDLDKKLRHLTRIDTGVVVETRAMTDEEVDETAQLAMDFRKKQEDERRLERDRAEAVEGMPSKDELEALLSAHGGVLSKVGFALGKDRRVVHRWAQKLGIDVDTFRATGT